MMLGKVGITFASLLLFVAFWMWISATIADPQVLPTPVELAAPFKTEFTSGALTYHLRITLVRVAWAFVLAMTLGTILGFVMGVSPSLNRWLDPWLVVFLNLPALVLIVLCYLWIGLTETAAITAVTMNKIPNVAVLIREGTRALDANIKDLARVYRLGFISQVVNVTLPQLSPYLTAAARNGIAVIWKIVLVVEFLGRSNGVGFQIHLYFQLFDVSMILVYASSFIAVMLLVEWLLLQPLERKARRWRGV